MKSGTRVADAIAQNNTLVGRGNRTFILYAPRAHLRCQCRSTGPDPQRSRGYADAGARKVRWPRVCRSVARACTTRTRPAPLALDPTRRQTRAAVRRAAHMILRAEAELQETGAVIANGFRRLDRAGWIRVVEKTPSPAMVRRALGSRLSAHRRGAERGRSYPLPDRTEGGRMRKLVFVLVAVLRPRAQRRARRTTVAEPPAPRPEPPGRPSNGDCADLTGEGATFTITISDFAFDPNCFTASASQGITIVNQDAADHTFTITGTACRRPDRRRPDLQRRADLGSREPGDLRLPVHAPPDDDGAGHDRRVRRRQNPSRSSALGSRCHSFRTLTRRSRKPAAPSSVRSPRGPAYRSS